MKFLNLVLYSQNDVFDKMMDITSKYYKTLKNVKTIYYRFDPNISSDFELKDNILLIKGTETFIPGILDKTIKAFEFVKNNKIIDDYDYLIRSNISTIVNFKNLEKEMIDIPFYGGVFAPTIDDFHVKNNNIIDEKLKGIQFVTGSGIILSKDSVKYLINNKHLLNTNIIDDVALGIFFNTNLKINPVVFDRKFWHVWYEHESISTFDIRNKIFFRCRNKNGINRKIDAQNLEMISEMLINENTSI